MMRLPTKPMYQNKIYLWMKITYEAYVSEQNLLMDDSEDPIKHPLIEEIFSGKKGSSYFKPSN